MATIAVPLSAVWDAANIANLVAASDNTGHRALDVAATCLKLDFIEGDPETARTNLFGIASIIEVNVTEAAIMRFFADRSTTRSNGLTFHLTVGAPIAVMTIMAVMAIGAVSNSSIAAIIDIQLQGTVSGLHRNAACYAFARMAIVGQGWCSEEQRRRKGKRGCSRFHDAIYHDHRKSYPVATGREWRIRVTFMSSNRCPNIAILSDHSQFALDFLA